MVKSQRKIELALAIGFTIPTLYFGTQVVASLFFPDYSFLNRDASTLGSAGAPYPFIFNWGSILVGLVAFVASWGYFHALKKLDVNRVLTWATFVAVTLFGIGCINAGLFPIPDPRHTVGMLAILSMGMFLVPFLIPAVLWKQIDLWIFRAFFVLVICLVIILIPVNSGLVQRFAVSVGVDLPAYQQLLNNYHGLIQRVAAFTVVVPIAAGSFLLRMKIRE